MVAPYEPSPPWTGDVKVEGPVRQIRNGSPALRHDLSYLSGTVWAIDASGIRAGYQTFDVYPELHIVLLDQAGLDKHDGDNGVDNRRQGGARAMLDELDKLYPEPEWWMASANVATHTQDGIDLMRGRHKPGRRRKVHTEDCALSRPDGCSCDFRDKAPSSE